MTAEQAAGSAVRAVVVYDGRLLLVEEEGRDGWGLPSGVPEPAETPQATAARLVYESTGYLVDGSATLGAPGGSGGTEPAAVVCQLLSEDPSSGARLAPERIRWAPMDEPLPADLPGAVRDYLAGHTPV
ncbi:NUDIX domain-containing protein [Streptomyces sp. NRRL S-340]|uniref:NUDIX domain-containing protein n=1 Tax=Streptomyces sp. NRRL S-340 TaxID=1463901 RepID=UPI00055A449F|nr:NUDIX domain-containing protein [Streptomyces sp. NRRL S-340]